MNPLFFKYSAFYGMVVISAYECGKRYPQKTTIHKLAEGLDIDRLILEDHAVFCEKAVDHLCNFDVETGEFSLFREE